MDFAIASGVFGLLLVVILVLATGRRDYAERAMSMLEDVTRPERDEAEEGLMRSRGRRRPVATTRIEKLFEMLFRISLLRWLEEATWRAGLHLNVQEVLLIIALMFGAGMTLGNLLLHDMGIATMVGLASGAAPIFYLYRRRKRRLQDFVVQLPFALDLIKSSLEAGHSLLRALQVLVQEFNDPLQSEFRTVIEQARLGMPLAQALDQLLERMPEEDLRLFVVAIKVQSESGSSLAQIVGRLSEIVRTRQRLHQQIHTMTAQSRMSGLVVGLLPAIVLGVFSLVQPGYANVLLYDPTGQMALKIAIGLDAMAFFTIRRILKVDY